MSRGHTARIQIELANIRVRQPSIQIDPANNERNDQIFSSLGMEYNQFVALDLMHHIV